MKSLALIILDAVLILLLTLWLAGYEPEPKDYSWTVGEPLEVEFWLIKK